VNEASAFDDERAKRRRLVSSGESVAYHAGGATGFALAQTLSRTTFALVKAAGKLAGGASYFITHHVKFVANKSVRRELVRMLVV